MELQTLLVIVIVALTVIFAASYMKELVVVVKTEGFNGATPICTYTAIPIPNAYIPNCSGTEQTTNCIGYPSLSEAQTACNSALDCKGITYLLDPIVGPLYTLRRGYVADPSAPVTSTVSSLNGESSYLITNLAVCKPNWQAAAAGLAGGLAGTAAGAAGTAAGIAGGAAGLAGTAAGAAGATAGAAALAGTAAGAAGRGVTIPGGTMVLTSAMNTIWANSMASQPAFLQGGAAMTAAGAGAGTGGV